MRKETAIESAYKKAIRAGDNVNIYSVISSYKVLVGLPQEEMEEIYNYIAVRMGLMKANIEEQPKDALDLIMDIYEAGKLWGLESSHVRRLCISGEVRAKKVGNAWAILKGQPNPAKRERKH